jgi:hypothetical protein
MPQPGERWMAELGQEAALALRTLQEHPWRCTPRLIAEGPFGYPLEPADVASGLRELQVRGLAREQGGRWGLSEQRHQAA